MARSLILGIATSLWLASFLSAQELQPLSQRVPAADLVFYVEFDGFNAHSKEWKASAAYKALNQTTLGVLLEDLAAQGLDLAMKGKVPNPPKGTEVVKTLETISRKGFAFALHGKTPASGTFTFVARGGMSPEIFDMLKRLEPEPGKPGIRGSRKTTTFGDTPKSTIVIDDKGDLVATTAGHVDEALAILDGKATNASINPNYIELARSEGTFQPIALAFVDPKMFGPIPPEAEALGIDGLKRIDYRWGVNDTALSSVFRIVAPSPRKGILAIFDGPTFDKTTLPPLPAGSTEFTVMALSPAQLVDKILAIAGQSMPNGDQQIAAIQQMVNQQLGADLRKDLLARLGPKWSVYGTGTEATGGLPINIVALTELVEPDRFATALDSALKLANAKIKASAPPNAARTPVPEFQKLAGTQLGFELVIPAGMIPPGPMSSIKPTILIGKKYLVISSTAKAATSALAMADGNTGRWKPDAIYTKILDTLPKGIVFLSVSDPRQTLPQMIAGLPLILGQVNMAMIGQAGPGKRAIPIDIDPEKIPKPADLSAQLFPAYVAVSVDDNGINLISREALPGFTNPATTSITLGLLLPAVQAARESARRQQCASNLRLIGLGLLQSAQAKNRYPNNISTKDGKPLLSWRVQILPYVNQLELYNKFKLDEPWDSVNNKPLLNEMPAIFRCLSHPAPEPSMTFYQGWAGTNTMFPTNGAKVTPSSIRDGSSQTLLVTESLTAVPWTKPADLPFDPDAKTPLFGAGSMHPGVFNVLFCDGSVKVLKVNIAPATLKALITPNGRERLDPTTY